jgi:hypothetical protein
MEFLRALLFALGVFVLLGVIAMLVAGLMQIIYSTVHKKQKTTAAPGETKSAEGKVG